MEDRKLNFSTDKPIESDYQDSLGRSTFANHLADSIMNYESREGLVIGLYGKWGSGKTSIANMTINRIEESYASDKNRPIIIKFSPWNYSDKNNLISLFFNNLESQINKKAHTEGTSYTNDLSNIRSNEMGDVVDAKDKARFNRMLGIIAIVAGIGLYFLNPYFIILTILGLIFYIYNRANDKVKIDYDMTKEAKEELEATNDLLAGIMESDAVWLVTETEEFADDKEDDMRIKQHASKF